MATPNFRPTRKEAIAALVEALYARELATSAEEYHAKTNQIMKDLGRMKCPTDRDFKDRADRGRAPWIRIMERALEDINDGSFKFPFWLDAMDGDVYLLVRTNHIMEHINLAWPDAPNLTGRALKRCLHSAGILFMDDGKTPGMFERTIPAKDGRRSVRCGHLNALLLWKVKMYCEGGSQ